MEACLFQEIDDPKARKRLTNRAWQQKNREKRNAYAREYYAKNKDRIKPLKKKTRERNKETLREYYSKWNRSERGRELKRLSRIRRTKQRKEYQRKWREKNPDKERAKQRLYRSRHQELVKERNRLRRERMSIVDKKDEKLRLKYGITFADYQAMLESQNGTCALCNSEGTQWIKGAKHIKFSLAVDHCHKTGKVRGLLCHGCNTALGRFKDDPEILTKAIEYLKGAG